ncbi:MAG: peroxiredoxin family protein [Actinobacteria bacterium]|nr:peroxiredoxin family protein [Actinomycetota bacterium]MCL5885680.1 peroxiredoxin family protein [Actinomycetota bacterium]
MTQKVQHQKMQHKKVQAKRVQGNSAKGGVAKVGSLNHRFLASSNVSDVKRQRRANGSVKPFAGDRRFIGIWLVVVAGAIAIIVVIALMNTSTGAGSSSGGSSANISYKVASPGPGRLAPSVDLRSTNGGEFNLASQHGKTVLLYFQEGVTCSPCWVQLQDIQHAMARFHKAGINEVVTITTNSLSDLRQMASDYSITLPILSDPSFSVSHAYNANQYGMMGTSADGHTFILVGPNGHIRWRADYGGPPHYTMFVPVGTLLQDMHGALHRADSLMNGTTRTNSTATRSTQGINA